MQLSSAIPVLRVGDYPAAKAFWLDVLRFDLVEEAGTPANFGLFRRDGQVVFVDGWNGKDFIPSPGWRAFFHCDDVAALAQSIGTRAPVDGPTLKGYGLIELVVTDPSGNRLCFAQESEVSE